MQLSLVGLTGWDETVSPKDVVSFLEKYPYAAAGIHFSEERRGEKRHPREPWVQELETEVKKLTMTTPYPLHLDAHLGNKWSLQVASGDTDILGDVIDLTIFQRIQLNHIGKAQPQAFLEGIQHFPNTTFIVSRSRTTEEFCAAVDKLVTEQGITNVSFLFDSSWGQGETPEAWPEVSEGTPCGYAGGLGPDNLSAELEKLKETSKGQEVWVDMESKLRSKSDLFSVGRCEQCMTQARKYLP